MREAGVLACWVHRPSEETNGEGLARGRLEDALKEASCAIGNPGGSGMHPPGDSGLPAQVAAPSTGTQCLLSTQQEPDG